MAENNTYLLSHNLHGSGVWPRLSWVLCSRSDKDTVKTSTAMCSPGGLAGKEFTSKHMQVIGRTNFLVVVWGRVPALCWLVARCHPHTLEAAHSSPPYGSLLRQFTIWRFAFQSQEESLPHWQSLIWCSLIKGMISHHLYHMLLVIRKPLLLPTLTRRELHECHSLRCHHRVCPPQRAWWNLHGIK